MAVEGGTNRPSSTDDDAYNGLYVTIEAGTGAGQVLEPVLFCPDLEGAHNLHHRLSRALALSINHSRSLSRQTRTIDDYHGNSRTAFLNQPWSVIPDATSLYRIHFTAEVFFLFITLKPRVECTFLPSGCS